MKTLKLLLSLVLIFLVSSGYAIPKDSIKTMSIKHDTINNDSTEYDIEVLDPAFDSYLITQPPKDFYPESYYKGWNKQYVAIWNERYLSQAHTGLYETYIDYDPKIEYGLNVEYKLYYFFHFFEKKTGVVLIPRGR
jgi:hypothetical protein